MLGHEFSVTAKVPKEGKTLLVTFLPVKNVKGVTAAYFVSYRDDKTLSDSHKRLNRVMFGVIVFASFFLAGGYIYFWQEQKKNLYENMAMTDRLTKVANRQHFDLIFDQIIKEAKRRKEIFPLCCLILMISKRSMTHMAMMLATRSSNFSQRFCKRTPESRILLLVGAGKNLPLFYQPHPGSRPSIFARSYVLYSRNQLSRHLLLN